jgi:hypothetical protein
MSKPADDKELYGAPLELDDSHSLPKHNPTKSKKSYKFLLVFFVLLLISLMIFGTYTVFVKPKPVNNLPTNPVNQSSSENEQTEKDNATAKNTKKHTGDFPRIELSYPNDWQLTEKDNAVLIESPEFTYDTVKQSDVSGNFKFYIRQGAREQEGKYIGSGVAIRKSEKLVYKAPSASQRADTNLTLFGIDTPDYFNYFMVSGDYIMEKNDTLGPNYGREAETFIIVGGFSSKERKDPMDFNSVEIKQALSSKTYKQAIDILKSLKVF